MNIQIFGTKKCKDTKKAERFFKERNIKFHFVDLNQKEMSSGEFNKIKNAVGGADKLINTDSKIYKKKLQFMSFDAEEEILDNMELLKTPVVRNGNKATVGNCPDVWKKWIEE